MQWKEEGTAPQVVFEIHSPGYRVAESEIAARQRADAEQQRADAERQRAERLAARLRELAVDLD